MADFVLFTDSCSDLSLAMVKKIGVEVIPMSFMVDDKIYRNYPDEREMTTKNFYDLLRNKKTSSTSQLNPQEFDDIFRKYLEKGLDVLYIAFSSALSGTYASAVQAGPNLEKEYPGRKVVAVDSLAASMGLGLLTWHAATLKKQGKTLEEIQEWLEKNKKRLDHLFTVDDLMYLKRGGRLSAVVATIGTIIKLKPLLHVSPEGKLVQTGVARGRRQALNRMVDRMMQTIEQPLELPIFISHGDCPEDVEYMSEQVKMRIPGAIIETGYIGPVIGSHSGPGTIAIYYLGNDRL